MFVGGGFWTASCLIFVEELDHLGGPHTWLNSTCTCSLGAVDDLPRNDRPGRYQQGATLMTAHHDIVYATSHEATRPFTPFERASRKAWTSGAEYCQIRLVPRLE